MSGIRSGLAESVLFFEADANHDVPKFRRQFIKDCNAGRERNGKALLTDDEEEAIETNLNDLLNLSIYTLPTLRN